MEQCEEVVRGESSLPDDRPQRLAFEVAAVHRYGYAVQAGAVAEDPMATHLVVGREPSSEEHPFDVTGRTRRELRRQPLAFRGTVMRFETILRSSGMGSRSARSDST